MSIAFGPRRAEWIKVAGAESAPLTAEELARFEAFDLVYRSLCALLYNYVPQSGHPGGSISSGRIVAGVLFDAMDYELAQPDREDADIISYAAGHKAMGLYAMWALRDEVARVARPELLPADIAHRLRLARLQEREALEGMSADPSLTIEIENIKAVIARMEREAPQEQG
jgi:transketolase